MLKGSLYTERLISCIKVTKIKLKTGDECIVRKTL